MTAGCDPIIFKCFTKMKLNGVRYECKNDNNNKFSNWTIFNGLQIFGEIISIINFDVNEVNIGGILINQLQQVNFAFGTQHIREVFVSNNIVFVKESELIIPAVQIFGLNKMFVIRQANCWETD